MSLESQLHSKADEHFKNAYGKLFTDFSAGLQHLTGRNLLDSYHDRTKELDPLREFLKLRYFEGDPQARVVFQAARDFHRERFVAAFIASVEHSQSFLGEQS